MKYEYDMRTWPIRGVDLNNPEVLYMLAEGWRIVSVNFTFELAIDAILFERPV